MVSWYLNETHSVALRKNTSVSFLSYILRVLLFERYLTQVSLTSSKHETEVNMIISSFSCSDIRVVLEQKVFSPMTLFLYENTAHHIFRLVNEFDHYLFQNR